jgi:hypothetical protein
MDFHLGLNHPHQIVDKCDPTDQECLDNDLFHSKFDNNLTAAALAELKLYQEWGFNAAGYDSPTEHWAALPFMKLNSVLAYDGASVSEWASNLHFPDVFNLTVQQRVSAAVDRACEKVRPYREHLIGYIWNDVPAFNVASAQQQRGTDWVTSLRCLPWGAPGRQEYSRFLQQRYAGDLSNLCSAYAQPAAMCASWQALDLCKVKNTEHPAMMSDDAEFLPRIVREYHQVCNATIKRCDPGANVFADTVRAQSAR